MKYLLAVAIAILTVPAIAQAEDVVKVLSSGSVEATADRLEAAIGAAGATVAARVDHAAAAASVGLVLDDAQLLIFGNPQIGTSAMQDDILAGLYLPLSVLVYKDDQGQVWLAYEEPSVMFDGLDGISTEAPVRSTAGDFSVWSW